MSLGSREDSGCRRCSAGSDTVQRDRPSFPSITSLLQLALEPTAPCTVLQRGCAVLQRGCAVLQRGCAVSTCCSWRSSPRLVSCIRCRSSSSSRSCNGTALAPARAELHWRPHLHQDWTYQLPPSVLRVPRRATQLIQLRLLQSSTAGSRVLHRQAWIRTSTHTCTHYHARTDTMAAQLRG
jgi:hypothetical protein